MLKQNDQYRHIATPVYKYEGIYVNVACFIIILITSYYKYYIIILSVKMNTV